LPISPKAVIYRSLPRPEQFPISKLVRLDEALAERINEFRFRERFKPEADVIRELIQRGLEGATETKPVKAQAR
jgi:Arc/MetJ-type ribon-helix-helix transcriptional regulator